MSRIFSLGRSRVGRTRTATALAVVGALVMSAGLVMLSGSSATANDEPEGKKVVVCKYVGTPPGTPHHIIVVSVNAIKDFPENPTFPWTFADAQDSVAIRFAVGNEQPGDEELVNCPERRETKTPAGITTNDPCGPNNVTWAAKPDDYFNYTESGGVVTATLKNPGQYLVSGQTTWTLADYESNEPCPPDVVAVPAKPGVNDPCGPDNATWIVPADDATFDWTLTNGVLTVDIIKANTTFPDQSTTHSYGTATDSGVPCVLGTEEIAPEVTFADPTCAKPNRTTWSGNLTDLVDYTESAPPGRGRSITVTASVKPDLTDEFAFPAGFDTPSSTAIRRWRTCSA